MSAEGIGLIVQGGIAAILLFILQRQNVMLQQQLDELKKVRDAQWSLIVALVGEHRASMLMNKPGESSTSIPITPR